MQLGLQTLGLMQSSNIKQVCMTIQQAGFSCLDFSMEEFTRDQSIHFYEKPVAELLEWLAPLRDCAYYAGLTFAQAHAVFPMYAHEDEEKNKRLLSIVEKNIDMAAFLKCPYLVVHPINLALELGKQTEWELNMERYRKLIPKATEAGVIICLENLFRTQNGVVQEGACSNIASAISYIDTLNSLAGCECFGFCLDTGHAALLGLDIYSAVVQLGQRLKCLHIHSNDGFSDLHSIPYILSRKGTSMPAGEWQMLLQGLKAIQYQGVLNFEIFRALEAFPPHLHPYLLRLVAATGEYWIDMLQHMD